MSARRRVFVGDVQGCRDELERLLEAVRFDPAADDLQPVGDVVNRGPDSAGTLRLLRELGAGGVLGNHDVHLLRTAAGERSLGKRDTIQDVLEAPDREELLDWLGARPLVRVWDDVVCVHAALHPAWANPAAELDGLDWRTPHPYVDFATRARYCAPTGDLPASDWPPPPAPYRPWYEVYREAHPDAPTLVFGHWARGGLVVRPGVRGLDTGCVWGQRLTAWLPDEDRLVHVDAARAYSPMSKR